MNTSILLAASDKITEWFRFLQEYGYVLSKSEMINESKFEIILINDEKKKKINIGIWNSGNTTRFFLTISIVRIPYVVVNDFVDFDTFLQKNNISVPASLDGDAINQANIGKYIEAYADLFQSYGIELITTDKQFPHYFPEWT